MRALFMMHTLSAKDVDIKKIKDTQEKVKRDRTMRAKLVGTEDRPLSNGTVVIAVGKPYHCEIPQDLARDSEISRDARLLWGIYHSYSQKKQKAYDPSTFVGQGTLCQVMGARRDAIYRWTKELREAGWLDVERRGLNKPNLITLYWQKRRVR